MSEDDRRQAYLERLDGILETRFLSKTFEASMDAFRCGPLSITVLDASPRSNERTAARIAHDRYDSIGVQLVLSGRARGKADGLPVASEPGTVMLLDYGRPFLITDEERRHVVNVAVPRSLFPADPAGTHGVVLRDGMAAPLAAFMGSLPMVLTLVPADAGPVLARSFLDLLAVSQGDYRTEHGRLLPAEEAIGRAEALVDARLASPDLDPAWLASKLNVSRSELYTILDRFGGAARFIQGRRLAVAHAALADPCDARRIGEIAYALGFSSEAHFARAFRASFGCTASDVRRQALVATVS